MRHVALFNGIGGFQLAADWMGWENVASCEIDEFCNKVTKYYWPNCIQHHDIRTTDFSVYRGKIDIVTGGFPCQPYSLAGLRKGKEDDRHLWPEMLRAVREIQPPYVVGENVFGIVNWSGGLVFEEVQTDLENEGYEVQAFILPACAVNAPHRRDRVWFVAHAIGNGNRRGLRSMEGQDDSKRKPKKRWEDDNESRHNGQERNATNANVQPRQRQREFGGRNSEVTTDTTSIRQPSEEHGKKESRRFAETGFRTDWQNFPTVSPICDGDDGIPSRLDSITFPKWRNESIKAGGNAIVPQVAYEIFKAIELTEKQLANG